MRTLIPHLKSRFGREDGQSLIEFALIAPFLVLLFVGILQFGDAFRNSIAITDAARVAARAAAVSTTPCPTATAAIEETAPEQWDVVQHHIDCTTEGESVKIVITYPDTIFGLPGITTGRVDFPLKASATERMEGQK